MITVSKEAGLNLPISSIGLSKTRLTPRNLQTCKAPLELSMAVTSSPLRCTCSANRPAALGHFVHFPYDFWSSNRGHWAGGRSEAASRRLDPCGWCSHLIGRGYADVPVQQGSSVCGSNVGIWTPPSSRTL